VSIEHFRQQLLTDLRAGYRTTVVGRSRGREDAMCKECGCESGKTDTTEDE